MNNINQSLTSKDLGDHFRVHNNILIMDYLSTTTKKMLKNLKNDNFPRPTQKPKHKSSCNSTDIEEDSRSLQDSVNSKTQESDQKNYTTYNFDLSADTKTESSSEIKINKTNLKSNPKYESSKDLLFIRDKNECNFHDS